MNLSAGQVILTNIGETKTIRNFRKTDPRFFSKRAFDLWAVTSTATLSPRDLGQLMKLLRQGFHR